jgi:hypothetical protein
LKNTLAYYNAGVVDANSKVVGLAPGWTIFAISGDDCFPLAIFS